MIVPAIWVRLPVLVSARKSPFDTTVPMFKSPLIDFSVTDPRPGRVTIVRASISPVPLMATAPPAVLIELTTTSPIVSSVTPPAPVTSAVRLRTLRLAAMPSRAVAVSELAAI